MIRKNSSNHGNIISNERVPFNGVFIIIFEFQSIVKFVKTTNVY